MYTCSKAEFSIFIDWTGLGSTKHQTQAEIDDAHNICTDSIKTYECLISSIPVDNAARAVANVVCIFLGNGAMTSRDPAHCMDLLSNDLSQTGVVKRVMAEAKEVRDFVKIDPVDSIGVETNKVSATGDYICTAVSMCYTRMNSCYDYILAARKQHDFEKLLWRNE